MKRFAWIWLFKLLCAALGIVAMTVMTRHVMRLECESRAARHTAEHGEKIRLALWRMESEANALLLSENTRGTVDFLKGEPPPADYVRAYFQFDQRGNVELMNGMEKAKSDTLCEIWAGPVEGLQGTCNGVHAHVVASQWNGFAITPKTRDDIMMKINEQQVLEKAKRQETYSRNSLQWNMSNITKKVVSHDFTESSLIAGDYRPLWMAGELFLVRKLMDSEQMMSQGVWMNKDLVKQRLLELCKDLLPTADLVAAQSPLAQMIPRPNGEMAGDDALALVSLPWRLEAKEIPDLTPISSSPAMTAMRFAWVGLTVAFIAGSVLVMGLVRLSERRAAFVSSVTHELRTPLTTFQLYTDLLANGMVREESKRQGYFETLRREADRLGHLVENVLAFAQVERGSAKGGLREVRMGETLPAIIERMEPRLQQAGWEIEYVIDDAMRERSVLTDPVALEHILLNLVDNAVKYAQPSREPKVVLRCEAKEKQWEVSLRDFGPGIDARERRHIFRAFHKSAQSAAHSKPGVGLGLALSKRLAKSMAATLEYRAMTDGGACFVLTGPLLAPRT